ncbi:MAG: signal transduction protein containing a membrane domain an EAL and a GGDEF domain [Halothiobacillaceae bacterium]|nr:MAG: signal transduction protein containing a membrane domain an EAL and a GGDEF domain [Halothiobacillaceae bacterium]
MKSLSTRLALVISTILFVLMLVAGFWVERQLKNTIFQEEINQAEVHAKTLLASLQTLMLNGQGTLAREWLDRMRREGGVVDIRVLRRDGTEAFTDLETVNAVNSFLQRPQFSREPSPPHPPVPISSEIFQRALQGQLSFDHGGNNEITVMLPIHADTVCLACHGYDTSGMRGVMKLSLSTVMRDRRIGDMRANLWAIAFVLALVLGTAIFLALRWNVLRPIAMLRDAIVRVGQGDRGATLPTKWRDELGEVASVFNRMQNELLASEATIRSVMDNVLEGIIIINEAGIIQSVNPAALLMFDYKNLSELVGKNIAVLMPEPYQSMHDRYIANYLATGNTNVIGARARELVGLRQDGTTFAMEISVSEMRLEHGRYFVGAARDITERKEQLAAIEHAALHDGLTDLPNRSLLADRLRQAVLHAQRNNHQFALLLMDLDHFKEINDTLGHHYGDLILQQVARRMTAALRESDTVARLGGDEFAVLLATSDVGHATQVAKKLLRMLEQPFVVDGQSLHVGGSIGIALYPVHGEDEMTLMRLADVAMYVAKRQTQGYSLYDPHTDEHNPRNLALLGELRTAIDTDELLLYYQPKVHLKSHKVTGVEALVRWRHPAHGLMYPDEFIQLAEQTGLIKPLTMWVLKESLRQMAQWRDEGLLLDIAVNLSARNLQDVQFPERVARIVSAMCKSTNKLWLEITETAIMADPQRARGVLMELHDMNINLSVDDFGTGYSSLTYLRQLPVKEIKIDKSFVIGMVANENDAVIVKSIIDLAHNIGLQVIAEGAESDVEYSLLEELGCDYVQGYHVSQPLPAEEFTLWLKTSAWPV